VLHLLYNIFIRGYYFVIWLAHFFYPKAKLWINGRKNTQKKLEIYEKPLQKTTVWMHCASLGEFEQGRPVIEKLKSTDKNIHIVLTFFSPSGYEIRKNYALADEILYLPLDTAKNVALFLDKIQPDIAIFVKYEFWFHTLNSLKNRNIPTILIAAIFRKEQVFFKNYGGFFREILQYFSAIFVQNAESEQLLHNINLSNIHVVGDTRVDRVVEVATNPPKNELINSFIDTRPIIVCGSTWQPDEAILLPYIHSAEGRKYKWLIAPHDTSETHVSQLVQALKVPFVRYTMTNISNIKTAEVVIIDTIGLLNSFYQYGKIAYIGGGFGTGIHNTLEPMAFGLPVVFGKKYEKFVEATVCIKKKGAFSIAQTLDFQSIIHNLENETNYKMASEVVKNYIKENSGATDKIIDYLNELIIDN
jgi:3-deoxy-D-manno-octulosonic-acid transferase